MPPAGDGAPSGETADGSEDDGAGEETALARFTQSLTDQAAVGLIDPIIGWDAEIRQIVDILMR